MREQTALCLQHLRPNAWHGGASTYRQSLRGGRPASSDDRHSHARCRSVRLSGELRRKQLRGEPKLVVGSPPCIWSLILHMHGVEIFPDLIENVHSTIRTTCFRKILRFLVLCTGLSSCEQSALRRKLWEMLVPRTHEHLWSFHRGLHELSGELHRDGNSIWRSLTDTRVLIWIPNSPKLLTVRNTKHFVACCKTYLKREK